MRFISPHAAFKVVAIPARPWRSPLGIWEPHPDHPHYIAEFRRCREDSGYTRHERDEAFRLWGKRLEKGGRVMDDMVTPVDNEDRVGTFDTKWVPEELRERVEQALLAHASYGMDFVHVPAVKLPAPWPNYDKLVAVGRRSIEMVVDQVVAKVTDDGYDPAVVLAYERENLDRPEVTAALEGLIELAGAREIEVVA